MKLNIFKRKAGPVFEVIRPHTAEVLPEGFFHCIAGERKTLGFRCANWFAYEVRTPVNDGKSMIHLADWLKAHNFKSDDELPTVHLTIQKADATQQNVGGLNIIETDSLEEFDGVTHYDGIYNSEVQWR